MPSAPALLALASGLGLGLSLIVAIGAQNAFVLRQGLRGEHVAPVVAVCAVSDAVLITAGVASAGAVLDRLPWLAGVMRVAGGAFLLGYGLLAARRAVRATALRPDAAGGRAGRVATVGTAVALTWLNPHVYLDTLVLLGSISTTYDGHRWWFAVGAIVGGVAWFTGLGFGARLLRPVFARPVAWRILDSAIAVVMIALAVSLLLSVS
jgi:L-lysine exporter family protein LysE/ArgO